MRRFAGAMLTRPFCCGPLISIGHGTTDDGGSSNNARGSSGSAASAAARIDADDTDASSGTSVPPLLILPVAADAAVASSSSASESASESPSSAPGSTGSTGAAGAAGVGFGDGAARIGLALGGGAQATDLGEVAHEHELREEVADVAKRDDGAFVEALLQCVRRPVAVVAGAAVVFAHAPVGNNGVVAFPRLRRVGERVGQAQDAAVHLNVSLKTQREGHEHELRGEGHPQSLLAHVHVLHILWLRLPCDLAADGLRLSSAKGLRVVDVKLRFRVVS
mmetsp:Transcript_31311/g.99466  ORF Transcript_31311/g.99466 Transcript_31311/m.99466 type:complete len:278 (-) Transcript_31311:548-1381(-)